MALTVKNVRGGLTLSSESVGKVRLTPQGIVVEESGIRVALDPRGPVKADYVFISHAHSDHVPSSVQSTKVITSKETARLVREKGLQLSEFVEETPLLKLVDTGHILGSRGLLIDGRIFYTGDMAGRPRGFLPKGRQVSCEELVMETTYGSPEYVFPAMAEILNSANRTIATAFAQNRPVALMGYSLGKSQILSYLFQSWDVLYACGSVQQYNLAYRELGVEMPPSNWLKTPKEVIELGRKAALLVCPTFSSKGPMGEALKKIDAVTMGFSGWATGSGWAHSSRVNRALPLSDHADFKELLSFVEAARPAKVHTVHGFTEEFALLLRTKGYDAKPLGRRQQALTEFMT
ncbi:MAG TPA: MBL fold metallo-hydrolase RNA specificity domain-containing protein [Conexivisphaerales archaeon]|nr:MBL fold metallo-hydrolase RNA specificity domain-containing protein [Conexivisphaerales archaeon]